MGGRLLRSIGLIEKRYEVDVFGRGGLDGGRSSQRPTAVCSACGGPLRVEASAEAERQLGGGQDIPGSAREHEAREAEEEKQVAETLLRLGSGPQLRR